jgi:hypothetical protein
MKINESVLQDGDIFFTAEKNIVSGLIRFFTKSKVSHCGQLMNTFNDGHFYRVEMTKDFKGKEDFKISVPVTFRSKNIVSIKRVNKYCHVYDTEFKRNVFRDRMIAWHQKQLFGYDIKELLANLPIINKLAKDTNKKDKICSRLVLDNLVIDGMDEDRLKFGELVTPDELFKCPYLVEVEGWRL